MIVIGRVFCPLLKGQSDKGQCRQQIPRRSFETVCNTPNFRGCRIYAEIMGELKTPIAWLQHRAVESGGRLTRRKGK